MSRTRARWFIAAVLSFALAFIVVLADDFNDPRLAPSLRMLLNAAAAQDSQPRAVIPAWDAMRDSSPLSSEAGDIDGLRVLVKLASPYSGRRFNGLPITASTGTILGLNATTDGIADLLANEAVVYIEPAHQARPTLDRSVPVVRADVVHGGATPIRGEGVIIGAVDTGIDYTHLDFRFDSDGDGFEESSRILAILDQTDGFFGVEYTRQDIETDLANGHGPNQGIVRQEDTDGHGTHVMAIAAGDGSSSSAGFVGVAPEAWIVMVKTSFFTSDILSGVDFIFDLAEDLGLPAIVNLSLGGHEGPHDGTSLFENGIDELVHGEGRVVVVSAGNEGDLPIHASGTLLGNSSSFGIAPDGWDAELSLWYPGSAQFMVTISPPSGPAIIAPWGTDTGVEQTAFGIVRIDNASLGTDPRNGDHEVFIRLSGLSGTEQWTVTVTDTGGNGGRYDAWLVGGVAQIINGDSSSTIDEPGNAKNVITVGSFNSKAEWPSLSGDQNYLSEYPLGVLSSFSSQGPTRDGRTKPDLCAPGAWIGAALSNDALWQGYLVHPDGVHTMELGTSMAAPHVAGAAALLLSVNPGLTSVDVRSLLTTAALRDGFTGSVPNNRWGWGKLDVVAAIAGVDIPDPPPVDPPTTPSEKPQIVLEENPVDALARFSLSLPDGATTATVRIYSANGALVYEAPLNTSSDRLDWPLITNRGSTVASGLYLYVLITDRGTSDVGKLVIAR